MGEPGLVVLDIAAADEATDTAPGRPHGGGMFMVLTLFRPGDSATAWPR
ncbi:DUF6207 family protein [Streptomyces violascens]|nr:DUF6207 family protein [Streptomyces violascens]